MTTRNDHAIKLINDLTPCGADLRRVLLALAGEEPAEAMPPDGAMRIESCDLICDNNSSYVVALTKSKEKQHLYYVEPMGETRCFRPVENGSQTAFRSGVDRYRFVGKQAHRVRASGHVAKSSLVLSDAIRFVEQGDWAEVLDENLPPTTPAAAPVPDRAELEAAAEELCKILDGWNILPHSCAAETIARVRAALGSGR
jgi:hypothetical protein